MERVLVGFSRRIHLHKLLHLHKRSDMTVICLVGGVQEIHTGEAGISEWIKALNETFTHWKVYIAFYG